MKFKVEESYETGEITYALTISQDEMMQVELSQYDRMLFADCEKDDATIADKILALEMLARRVEEAVWRKGLLS